MVNFFKKSLFLTVMALLTFSFVQAEESEFTPYWSVTVQGGVGHTIGELSFMDLTSPSAALSGSYKFNPIFGLRAGFSGWQAHGNVVRLDETYNFNYVQTNFDAIVDVMSIFKGYKSYRVVNPYLFAGFGVNVGFNGEDAVEYYDQGYLLDYAWQGRQWLMAGRAGVGVDFNIIHNLSVGLEANVNMLPDKFNAKNGGAPDWQYNVLAGVSVHFGKAQSEKPAKPEREPKVKPEREPKEKVEREPKVKPEREPKEKTEREPKVKPTPEPTPAPTPEPTPAPEPTEDADLDLNRPRNAYFVMGSDETTISMETEFARIVELMEKYPETHAYVTGYADAKTGTYEYNQEISKRRAESVKSALIKKGVAQDRITIDYKGDTVQPFGQNERNRAVIVILK